MKKLTALFISTVLIFTMTVPAFAAGETGEALYDKLRYMSSLITRYSLYAEDDDDPVKNALIKLFEEDPEFFDMFADAMFQSYDEFSHYIPGGIYDNVYPTGDSYVGVGVTIDPGDTGMYILNVSPGGPADKAGLLPGDKFLTVDGTDVTGYTDATDLALLLRGAEGTEVSVSILREGADAPLIFKMTRASIRTSNITFRDMGDGVAYIGISHFGDIMTYIDFASVYDDLPYEGFRSVIFDVRGNSGGEVDVCLNMLNNIFWDKDKTIFGQKIKTSFSNVKSSGIGWKPNKIIVLADEYSASVSEIFAGALKDWGYADIVGKTTYGKGLAQLHIPNGDDSYSVISCYEMLLPVSGSYNGAGIKPTYDVELSKTPYPLPVFFLTPPNEELRLGANSTAVLGLEQRLSHLGYFKGSPDVLFDEETLEAVNLFQSYHQTSGYKLSVLKYCDTKTINALLSEIDKLKNSFIYTDTQLEKALELAKEAAKEPLSYTLPEREPLSLTDEK